VTSHEHAGQVQRAGEASSADGPRPVNPYIAGAPVSGPEMFYGRDDVFAFIRHKLIGQHRDTPIVLKGERRTGKTSVLYQVHRHLNPAYRCVAIDLHGLSLNGIGDLLNGIAGSVSDSLRSNYGLDIAPPGRRAFVADPRSAFESAFLTAVLAALGEDHLVLMLDEVVRLDEEIRAGHLDREVFSYLRHLMQHYPRLNFIFSLGSGLEEMQKDYAFLFSAAMYHQISFLEETAARKLITDPVRGYFEVSPDAIDTILRVTSGHPYYTQLVCHSLFDRWSRAPKADMTAEDVHAVLGEAIELGSPNLTYVWEDSSPEEKAVMAAMAAAMRTGPRAVTGKAIRVVWRKAGVPLPERRLSAALRSLASREVITGSESYSFAVDLQRLWLDKHRRLEWLKDELADSIHQWIHDTRTPRVRYLAATAALIIAGCLTAWLTGVFSSGASTPEPNATLTDPNSQGLGTDAMAFGPGGTLAIGDENGRTYLWNITIVGVTTTEELPIILPDHGGSSVYSVAFGPDGTLATGDENGRTYLWNTTTGKLIKTLTDPGSSSVYSVAFRPDGTLAAGGGIGRTYLWNTTTGKLIKTLTDPDGKGTNYVAFGPGGTLAVGDGNSRTYLWNTTTGKLITALAPPGGSSVYSVAFRPDGTLATGDENGRTYLWNTTTGKLIRALTPPPGSSSVYSVAFGPHDTLATGDANSSAYLWNTTTGKLIATFTLYNSHGVFAVAFGPGDTLDTGDGNGIIYLWDTTEYSL
jgi:WD40 repeat protein